MKQKFERGQLVTAKAFGGETLTRRVVTDLGRRVVICSEAEYRDATDAGREPDGVGFPRADVSCQGRSKTRPLGRSKSRPVEYGEDLRFVGEEGVWSGGLRRLQGGAFRPERKTSSSPRRVRRSG